MSKMWPYLLVGLGGFVGANARFITSRWAGALLDTRFPLGTFLVNIAGSFLLGIVGTIVAQKVMSDSDAVRLALGVGFLGAFTTFSTFAFETNALLEDGSWVSAAASVGLSLFLGLVAVRMGIVLAKAWLV
jgi:CrcB protein